MEDTPRRRRRVRSSSSPTGPSDSASPSDSADVRLAPPAPAAGDDLAAAAADDAVSERSLRSLVGAGSSQLSPGKALRARDAARIRPQDLATSTRDLIIVRRNWSPRD